MKNLRNKADAHVFDARPGATLAACIKEASRYSLQNAPSGIEEDGLLVVFMFNGVLVVIKAESEPLSIGRDYLRAQRGNFVGTIGPYPEPLPEGASETDLVDAQAALGRQQQPYHSWRR